MIDDWRLKNSMKPELFHFHSHKKDSSDKEKINNQQSRGQQSTIQQVLSMELNEHSKVESVDLGDFVRVMEAGTSISAGLDPKSRGKGGRLNLDPDKR